jgi:hypothetical protein
MLLALLALTPLIARGQQGFCLADANSDGHPLFGNPEFMLNPISDALGMTAMVPTSAALGDLDGDGDDDAVAVYAYWRPDLMDQTTISVLLNDGDGIFHADGIYECGDYPSSVAIGDLNGDGLNDLAVTNTDSGQVSVLMNAGAAHFPSRVSYTVGPRPRSVVIADFNGDGLNDLAVLRVQTNLVTVLLNQGGGVFGPMASYPTAPVPETTLFQGEPYAFGGPYLSAADLDGDGHIDLIAPTLGLSILRNNGNGTFAAYVTYPAGGVTWGSAIGDVDADGAPDVVVPNPYEDTISALHNNGFGAFAPPTSYDVTFGSLTGLYDPIGVALGDLDHDGLLDVAAAVWTGYDKFVVFRNQGDGTFGPVTPIRAAERGGIVAIRDLNGDGHPDVACFTTEDVIRDKLCVLLNDGAGNLLEDWVNYNVHAPPTPFYWSHPQQLAFPDLDGDGRLDIVVVNQGNPGLFAGNVAVMRNLGDAFFADPTHYFVSSYYPMSLAVGDFDGDSHPDLVVGGPADPSAASPGYVSVLQNDGHGGFSVGTPYATGGLYTTRVVAADVDADDDLDILAINLYSSSLSVFLNDGGGNLGAPIVQTTSITSAYQFAVGDLNGDGLADVALVRDYGTDPLGIMLGNGDGTFGPGPVYNPYPGGACVTLADPDSDGDLDVVVSSGNDPAEPVSLTVMLNDGTGNFSGGIAYWAPGTNGAAAAAAADVNGDGKLDIAVCANACLSVFVGDGGGAFAPGVPYGIGVTFGYSVAAGDLDGDGHVDLGATNTGDQTFSILWNRQCQVGAPAHPGDLDNDGDVDLQDYAVLAACLAGPLVAPPPSCQVADIEEDGAVDLADVRVFQGAFGN